MAALGGPRLAGTVAGDQSTHSSSLSSRSLLKNRTFYALINGELCTGSQTCGVVNPATGETFAFCPEVSSQQLETAVAAGRDAFQSWRRVSLLERKEMVAAIASAVARHSDELSRILTYEQGKPLASARQEVHGASARAKAIMELDIPIQVLRDTRTSRVEVHRRPLGVVAAVTPWNFPLSTAFAKIYPALVAGNAVIVKPSPFTPLTMCIVGEILSCVVPPGLLQVLPGSDQLGQQLVEHHGIAKVTFTGSVPTGKRIQATCAERMARTTLELGGNDAAIVCRDADPASVAPHIFRAAMANSGQVCIAIKRVFVHESQYDSFCNAMVNEARRAKFGDGTKEGVEYGPLCNEKQMRIVEELVEDAKRKGASVLCGGQPAGAGFLYPPTVISNVEDWHRVACEEQFGPVVPILKYSTEEEAVRRANGTQFGLGGSVWSRDAEHAASLAAQLECGTAWVNQHMGGAPGAPFGGFKQSGIGREGGEMGLLSFTEPQTIVVSKTARL